MKVISGFVLISCALGAFGQQDFNGYNYMQQESPPFTYEAGTPPKNDEIVFRVVGEDHGDQQNNHVDNQYNHQEDVPTFKLLGNEENNLGGYHDNELRFRVLHEEEHRHENHAFDRPLVQMNGGFDYNQQPQQQQPQPQPQPMNVMKYTHESDESDGYDYNPPQPQRPERITFRFVKKEPAPRPVESFPQHSGMRFSEEAGFRGPRMMTAPQSFEHRQTKILRVLRDDGPSPYGGESELHQHTKVIRVIRQEKMSALPGHQQTRVLRIIEENRPQPVNHQQEPFRPSYSQSNFQRSAPVVAPQSGQNYQPFSNRNNQQVKFLRVAPSQHNFQSQPRFTRNSFTHLQRGSLKF